MVNGKIVVNEKTPFIIKTTTEVGTKLDIRKEKLKESKELLTQAQEDLGIANAKLVSADAMLKKSTHDDVSLSSIEEELKAIEKYFDNARRCATLVKNRDTVTTIHSASAGSSASNSWLATGSTDAEKKQAQKILKDIEAGDINFFQLQGKLKQVTTTVTVLNIQESDDDGVDEDDDKAAAVNAIEKGNGEDITADAQDETEPEEPVSSSKFSFLTAPPQYPNSLIGGPLGRIPGISFEVKPDSSLSQRVYGSVRDLVQDLTVTTGLLALGATIALGILNEVYPGGENVEIPDYIMTLKVKNGDLGGFHGPFIACASGAAVIILAWFLHLCSPLKEMGFAYNAANHNNNAKLAYSSVMQLVMRALDIALTIALIDLKTIKDEKSADLDLLKFLNVLGPFVIAILINTAFLIVTKLISYAIESCLNYNIRTEGPSTRSNTTPAYRVLRGDSDPEAAAAERTPLTPVKTSKSDSADKSSKTVDAGAGVSPTTVTATGASVPVTRNAPGVQNRKDSCCVVS